MDHTFPDSLTEVSVHKNILVIGADGIIGSRLEPHLRMQGMVPLGTSRRLSHSDTLQYRQLDLAQPESIQQLSLDDVDYAVLLAGITDISYCRHNKRKSWKVNVHGSGRIVKRLMDRSIPCLMVSSTCVFHEKASKLAENSDRLPSSVYGQQKKELEDLVAQGEMNLIVRINKVWGAAAGLVHKWHHSLQEGRYIEAFYDLAVAPIHIDSACRYLVEAILKSYTGVRHVSTDKQTNYYEIAKTLCHTMGVDPAQFVIPVSCEENPHVTYRPVRAFLQCEEQESIVLNLHNELSSIISDEISSRL